MFRIDTHRVLRAGLACLPLACGSALAAEPPAMPEDLSGYRFISALVVNDPESPLYGFHHFYVNQKGVEPLGAGGPYPEGTVFLGLVYEVAVDGVNIDEGGGAAVTLMEKVEGAEETGGWRFALFDTGGKPMEIDEAEDCFACHTQMEDRDYVFSRPVGIGALSSLK
jgi:hypothetical protein